MLNFFAGILAAIMVWGNATNPVVYSTKCQFRDWPSGEIISEWRVDHYWDGTEVTVDIEP